MTQEDDKGVASAALSIIERLRKDMDVSKVRNATIISRSQLDALESALVALRERACTPPPEAHVASAARAFMELFVAENGDERALTVDDIDHAELTHRYAALEAALEIRSLVPARFRSPPSPASRGDTR